MVTTTKKLGTTEEKVIKGISLKDINKINAFTPRVQRLKQSYIDTQSHVCADRAWFMMESFKLTEGEHPAKRRAKALANVLDKMDIAIRDDELIVGNSTPFIRGAHPNVDIAAEHLAALLQAYEPAKYTHTRKREAIFTEQDRDRLMQAAEYYKNDYPAKRCWEIANTFAGGLYLKMVVSRLMMGGGPTIVLIAPGADYEHFLSVGLNGIIEEARQELQKVNSRPVQEITKDDMEKRAFLESVIIALQGMIRFAHRHANLARKLAKKEPNPERKKELEEIAEICEWVPANPPRNFREALQAYWFIPLGHDIEKALPNSFVGRFDQYMWPFYKKDIDEGNITRQEAAELLGCLFVKWACLEPFLFWGLLGDRSHLDVTQANYFVNVTLGGITREGRDAANELSCLILEVARQVKTHQPHISVRWHHAMAPEFLDKAIECNRDIGGGIPAWFSDRQSIDRLLELGISMEDARDWGMAGCINTRHPQSFGWIHQPVVSLVNHAKLLELALNDGIDTFSGERLGTTTGDARRFRTYEDVLAAYKTQVDHYYEFCVNLASAQERPFYEDSAYFPFISAFLQDCIKNGKDASRGGGRYQSQEAPICMDRALTDTADSLMAIKKVVFDDKKATMGQLLDAMKADFEGYEDLRHMLLAAPKYGNDDDEVDSIAYDIWTYTRDKLLSYRDSQNRQFMLFRQGAAWSHWAGQMTGALPNGRKAWTALYDASLSAMQSGDTKGPTALLNSAAKLDPMHMDPPLLNMKITPGLLKTKEGKQKFAHLIATYFDKGGGHVQFNIVNKETLLDAKKHPENYRDLVVRVAGYSAFWVDITPDVQDEIISRTEHAF